MSPELILSLAIPAIAAVIQIIINEDKSYKKIIKIALSVLTLAGLAFALKEAYQVSAENNREKAKLDSVKTLLLRGEKEAANRSESIDKEFRSLHAQLSSEGINGSTILKTVEGLEMQVSNLATDSRNYFIRAIELTETNESPKRYGRPKIDTPKGKSLTPSVVPPIDSSAGVVSITESSIKIPFKYNKSIDLDTKNVITLIGEKPGENAIWIKFNSYDNRFDLGQEMPFINDQGKEKILGYRGKENGRFDFYIKDKR